MNCRNLVWNEAARDGTLKDVNKQEGCVNEREVFQNVVYSHIVHSVSGINLEFTETLTLHESKSMLTLFKLLFFFRVTARWCSG